MNTTDIDLEIQVAEEKLEKFSKLVLLHAELDIMEQKHRWCGSSGEIFIAALQEVCAEFRITPGAIVGPTRTMELCNARCALCWLTRNRGVKYAAIGKMLNRNHASIIYAVKTAFDYAATKPTYAARLKKLDSALTRRLRKDHKSSLRHGHQGFGKPEAKDWMTDFRVGRPKQPKGTV
jgi:chromosomal replication initiation ATPase DnaA